MLAVIEDVRTKGARPADQFHGLTEAADLCRQHPQQIQRIGIVRLNCQHLAVERFGLSQAAGLMVLQRGLKTGFFHADNPLPRARVAMLS